MAKHSDIPKIETYGEVTLPAFGYELFRSVLLPELLGEEQESLLYWAGRKVARQYKLHTIQDIIEFFHYAGWGHLTHEEKGKNQMTFQLSSDIVSARLKNDPNASFTLEAGFLAEQIQQQLGLAAEAYNEVKTGKVKMVTFYVKWDKKDAVNSEIK